MKIIERGPNPVEKLYRIKCRQCSTIFEFERHEATTTRDSRDGDFVSIPCPVCKTGCTHAL